MPRPSLLAPLGALVTFAAIGAMSGAATGEQTAPPAARHDPLSVAVHALDRVEQQTRTTAVSLAHDTVLVEDPALPAGQTAVREPGRNGTALEVRETTTYDGEVVADEVHSTMTVAEPVTQVVAVGTFVPPPPEPARPAEPARAVWDRLAQCESNGNWSINTGNGYYGGLQFLPSTWRAYGGSGMPHQASRAEQIRIAERVRAAEGGYGAWPACARKLGLPR